ncbi:MAG: hypothetical protein K9G41_00145 [Flavobacteriales bacterium]|nr:hypothetical protein [Flavobacteriales bacterium]
MTICFEAQHTYVSDLGFYLIGPQECGSPIIPISPQPQSTSPTNGCCCNSGNNIDSLCFSTESNLCIDVCNSPVPLSGTYGGYDSVSGSTLIDWTPLYGCPIQSGSWRAQIFDCIGSDVGTFTGGTLVINGLNDSFLYHISDENSSINDNSCTHQTASIIQFGTDQIVVTDISEFSSNDVALHYSSIDNAISCQNIGGGNAILILYDLNGSILFEATVHENQLTQLPAFRGIGIVKLFKGVEPIATSKLVRP